MTPDNWDALSEADRVAHWEQSESMIRRAIASLPVELPADDRTSVEDYLRANELGLAFDQLVGALIVAATAITAADLERLSAIADRFELRPGEWSKGLLVTSD